MCCFNGSTVREPWLSLQNGGIGRIAYALQWVHGSRTVVIVFGGGLSARADDALQWVHGSRTVVIVRAVMTGVPSHSLLQWVHGSRTVVIEGRHRLEQS